MYLFICSWRKRQQWRKEKQFIEAGRLAKLNQGLDMKGDTEYDQVAKKLQDAREEINRRKAADTKNPDRSKEIEVLSKQKEELQQNVRDLKAKTQMGENNGGESAVVAPQTQRKKFLPTADV